MYSIHFASSLSKDKHNRKQFFRVHLTFQKMWTCDEHQRYQFPSSSLCLNSQHSNLWVPTVDIKRGIARHTQWDKREKNSLSSLSPPQALCPSFLTRLHGCTEKRQRASEKRAMEKVTANETRAGEREKYSQRKRSTNPFHPCRVCAAPLTLIEKVWEHHRFDGWLGLYWPTLGLTQGTRGHEAERKTRVVCGCVCFYCALCDCVLLKHCRTGKAASSP